MSNILNQSATVIIGAGFGDEGKGLLTDFHAHKFGADCIVARFNGGAQAGHTVVLPDARRHVFSHFASGSLTGAETFLSRHFVSNPLLFKREKLELENLAAVSPVVFADERGLVTTPFDMLANQFAEAARGWGKHGSCGVGFGETIERGLHEQFATTIADLADAKKLRQKLDAIRRDWTPARLGKLNVLKLTDEQQSLLHAEKLIDDFIEAATDFYQDIKLARPDVLTARAQTIFEGAQGLLLDQDYGWFPHVTRSFTGLKNAIEIAREAGITKLDCVYATRAYATRHGAGHLPHELSEKPFTKIEDATNITNPHQDHLRFGWLDLDLLGATIKRDFELCATAPNIKFTKKLAVTCLDQLDEKSVFVRGGALCETAPNNFIQAAATSANVREVYASFGQTRATIEKIELFRRGVGA